MVCKGLLAAVVLGFGLTAQASDEIAKPEEQTAPISEKQQVVQAFEQSCRTEQLANCGCIAESLVPILSDAKVSLLQSQFQSGNLNNKNLIPRNQVMFNRAQSKCSG